MTRPIVGTTLKLFWEKAMATAIQTTTRMSACKLQRANTLVRADHKLVGGPFEKFEKARSQEKKKAIVTARWSCFIHQKPSARFEPLHLLSGRMFEYDAFLRANVEISRAAPYFAISTHQGA